MQRTITVTQWVHAAQDRLATVLLEDPGRVFGDPESAGDRRSRRFCAVLSVDLGSGASIRQEVDVQVEPVRRTADPRGFVLPLSWRAVGREKLFPTFTGELAAAAGRQGSNLTLRGTYTAPLGAVGRYGDRLAGHRVAVTSVNAFLGQIAARLESEVVRRIDRAPYQPAARPASFHDLDPISRPRSMLLEDPSTSA